MSGRGSARARAVSRLDAHRRVGKLGSVSYPKLRALPRMPQLLTSPLAPIALLVLSNVFMTFAWYGHLKFTDRPLWVVVLASWGIAFVEYWLAVPANRLGRSVYTPAQLKTMQEVITLVVFAVFSVLYLEGGLHAQPPGRLRPHRAGRVLCVQGTPLIRASAKLSAGIVRSLPFADLLAAAGYGGHMLEPRLGGRHCGRARQSWRCDMTLAIGDDAPDFEADTTEGKIRFHEWLGNT